MNMGGGKDVSKIPSFFTRLKTFKEERDLWVSAGKPMRTQEHIEQIFNTHCKLCEHYNGKSCNICGCMINTGTTLNKIAWSTTECPNEPPLWKSEDVPEEVPEDIIQEKKEVGPRQKLTARQKAKLSQPPPKSGCGCGS